MDSYILYQLNSKYCSLGLNCVVKLKRHVSITVLKDYLFMFVTGMSTSRAVEVLKLYKQLHRTVQRVFRGDESAIFEARVRIRSDFEKNKHVQAPVAVNELINLGRDCDRVLREQVFQLEVSSGTDSI